MYQNMSIGPLKLQGSDNYTGHPCQNTGHCHLAFYRPCSDQGKKPGDIMCADWTEADYRQDREDAYIVGLLWSINAGINFNIQWLTVKISPDVSPRQNPPSHFPPNPKSPCHFPPPFSPQVSKYGLNT